MQYRPEIDGLRAVAVLPVILFHAKTPYFSGGYVGVDIFFVISGFLITRILAEELGSGRFSLLRFYERRARRILPALLFVLALCLPFAWFWMLPDALENFGQSVVATIAFSNNILLWLTSGYWQQAADFKPLIHTWSLGIEEQFYVLFPLLLLAAWRFGRPTLIAALALLAVVSLLAAQIGAQLFPVANFYLLPTRAWELFAGALCALVAPPKKSDVLAWTGLALIVGAILSFNESTPYPSLFTLAPVGGSVLVILYAQAGTLTARTLSLGPLVFVGLISYSAYLWHQPLFAFLRLRSFEEPPLSAMLALAAAALVLAWLTWKYVEAPFRRRDIVSVRMLFAWLAPTALAASCFGVALHAAHGAPGRLFDQEQLSAAGLHIAYNRRVHAYASDHFPENGSRNVLVQGNSFARDFVNAGLEANGFTNVNLIYRVDAIPHCLGGRTSLELEFLRLAKEADVLIFASGEVECWRENTALLHNLGVETILFVGAKDFGYNLNAFVATPRTQRPQARAIVPASIMAANERAGREIGPAFVDLMESLGASDGRIPVFNEEGLLLSPDGTHLTRAGAAFVGPRLFSHPALRALGKAENPIAE